MLWSHTSIWILLTAFCLTLARLGAEYKESPVFTLYIWKKVWTLAVIVLMEQRYGQNGVYGHHQINQNATCQRINKERN